MPFLICKQHLSGLSFVQITHAFPQKLFEMKITLKSFIPIRIQNADVFLPDFYWKSKFYDVLFHHNAPRGISR